jgi:hypothetical protein
MGRPCRRLRTSSKRSASPSTPALTENDIDFTILGDLTDQDLEKIGVASLGHRRKLLRAIAALTRRGRGLGPPHCLRPRQRWRTVAAPTAPSAVADVAAERRHCHGDVLRSCGFDRHCRAARRRGMAGFSRSLPLTQPRPQSPIWTVKSPRSLATGSWRCLAARWRRRTIPSGL